MANQLQIQNKINNGLKRILGSFRQYKLVDTIEEGDILLAFYENDPEYFDVIFIDDEVKNAVKNSENTNCYMFFIRNKNRRNAKRQALADIDRKRFCRYR